MTSRDMRLRTVITVIFFIALWGELWRALSSEWAVNEQYNYGWFVPFFAAVLFWLRFEDRPEADPRDHRSHVTDQQLNNEERITNNGGAAAVGIAIFAMLLLLPLRLFEIGNPDWRPLGWVHAICVIAITLAFLWSLGGKPWLRHFAFPVLFTLVAVPWISPIEGPIIQGLMHTIANVAAETANLLGIPAQVRGNLIQVRTGLIGVNEACSGVRSLQTSLMIGLLFGELKRFSLRNRVILIAGAIAIALFANFARAILLVWLGAGENVSAIGRWHDATGYGIVAAVFFGTLLLAAFLGQRQRSQVTGHRSVITHSAFVIRHSSFLAAPAFIWLILVELAAAGWYRAHERNTIAQARWTVEWPKAAPGFREMKIDEGVRGTLRYDEGEEAVWNVALQKSAGAAEERPTVLPCEAFFFRWNPGGSSVVRARAHRPDICLPAAGWTQISRPAEPRPDLQVTGGAQPDWSFRGRTRVVLNGARNLGQQIIEIILVTSGQFSDAEIETKFADLVPGIVALKTK